MNVRKYIEEKVKQETLHMTLIDPDKQDPPQAAEIAAVAEKLGSDAIMLGGSTGVTQENLDATAKAVKARVTIPVIYFPSGAHAISPYCDAIYFMSILNSMDPEMIIGEQVMGALIVKKLSLEPISMGYIIVAPGMKVGEMSKARVLERDDVQGAVSYALAAEYLGMRMVYFEAGSGAPGPVPEEMVAAIKSQISIPLIIGGGIRSAEAAAKIRAAGADIIVTGTLIEGDDFERELGQVIEAIKND